MHADPSCRSPFGTLRRAVMVGVALCALGCGSDDDGSAVGSVGSVSAAEPSDTAIASEPPASTSTGPPAPDATVLDSTPAGSGAPGTQPEGFTTVQARITAADGEVCEVCLWLADSVEERGRGLMGVTDLGDAGGMAFLFDPPTTGAFYMFQTPTPLSIAWFAEDGGWVGSAEMEPCLDETPQRCTLYSPGASYTIGVETFAGGLEPLLLVDGSTIELLAGTENLECQTPSS